MEILSARMFPEMGEDAAYFHHHQQLQQQNSSFSLDDEINLFRPPFSSEASSNSSPSYLLPLFSPEIVPSFNTRPVETPHALSERPWKQLKTENCTSPCATEHKTMTCDATALPTPSPSPDSHWISFENPNLSPAICHQFYGAEEIQDFEVLKMKTPSALSRTPLHAQEHVLAERKRREKISERFIALAAIIPNLKKMDKATILEAATKYLEELQHRIKVLEEKVAMKTVESIAVVKKSQLTTNDHTSSSSNENSCDQIDQQLLLPEIEARVSGKCVLIKILCEKRSGCITKVMGEIEKLNLSIVNSCVLPFGSSLLDVTILAQMEAGLSLKVRDLVRNLHQSLLDFM